LKRNFTRGLSIGRWIYLLFYVIICSHVCCSIQTDVAGEKAQIEKLIREYNKAFDRGDISGFSQYCSPDMEFYTLDGRALKNPDFIGFLSPMFARWTNLTTEVSKLKIEIAGTYAFAKYHTKFTFVSNNNDLEMNNLLTVIFRKYGDEWKIIHYHMSTHN